MKIWEKSCLDGFVCKFFYFHFRLSGLFFVAYASRLFVHGFFVLLSFLSFPASASIVSFPLQSIVHAAINCAHFDPFAPALIHCALFNPLRPLQSIAPASINCARFNSFAPTSIKCARFNPLIIIQFRSRFNPLRPLQSMKPASINCALTGGEQRTAGVNINGKGSGASAFASFGLGGGGAQGAGAGWGETPQGGGGGSGRPFREGHFMAGKSADWPFSNSLPGEQMK
jgi:hypothetical protein